jgi:NADH:ubiquinone oxidoreductase subunit E
MLEVLGFFKLLFLDGTEALDTEDSLRSTMSPPGVELADSGLLGFDLPVCLGGCGNAPMLTVFRSVFP